MSTTNQINFTAEKRDALRKAYNEATKRNADTFTFEGNEYVVGYAKYLLQYLDTLFA